MSWLRNIVLKSVALPVEFLVAGTVVAIAVPCPAQERPVSVPPHRKKIALVLEGGGALGLAHVGVIEWLEENHIPVDAIAGTSMGGLVGGLYGMGYSPKEIHDTVAAGDWDAVLRDRLQYRNLIFRRREDLRSHPNSLEFGVVTGVHLKAKPLDPQESLSVVDVLQNSAEVVISANEARSLDKLQKADVAIVADLAKFTLTDYTKYKELIEQGRSAAESRANLLKMLSLNDEDWAAYIRQREARRRKAMGLPQTIVASAGDIELEEKIRHDLAKYIGREVNTKHLETDLDRLVGAGRFGRLGYGMTEQNGKIGLAIDATAKDNALAIITPVIEIDGGDYRTPIFTLGTRVTAFDLGGIGSERRSDLLLGSHYGFSSEYYRPVRAFSRFFASVQARLESTPFNIYIRNDHLAQYQQVNLLGAFDLGFNAGRSVQIRAGYEGGQSDLTRIIGAPLLRETASRIGTTSLRASFEQRDSAVVPRNCVAVSSSWEWHDGWINATDHFPTAETQVALFKSVSASGSMYLEASGGSTLGFANNGLPSFSLGGPFRLSADGTKEFLANQYFYGRAGYLHRVFAVPSLFGGTFSLTGAS